MERSWLWQLHRSFSISGPTNNSLSGHVEPLPKCSKYQQFIHQNALIFLRLLLSLLTSPIIENSVWYFSKMLQNGGQYSGSKGKTLPALAS